MSLHAMRRLSSLAATLMVLALASSASASEATAGGGAPTAHAAGVSCYGDYCTGKDAFSTGCARTRYRWGSADVFDDANSVDRPKIGRVELWISPECGTQWARLVLTQQPIVGYQLFLWQSTGWRKKTRPLNMPGSYRTSMVYSRDPRKCAWAQYARYRTGCTVR